MVVELFLKRGWEFQLRSPEEADKVSESYLRLVMAGAPIRDIVFLVHDHEEEYEPVIKLHNYIFGTHGVEPSVDAVLRSMEGRRVRRLLLDELLSLKAADLVRRVTKVGSE